MISRTKNTLEAPKYSLFTLQNGLRVALLPVKSRVVYCGFAVLSGSRDDDPDHPGLAHLVEHMLFKGTQKRRALHINKRMELVGGDLNAYTTKDETFFYAGAPRGELVRAMELLGDLLRHATFPEKELLKERTVVTDEINLYKDTPSDQIFDDWEDLYFRGTPLGHPILGTPESVMSITPEDMKRYVRNRYRPERMLFFCMGQVSEGRFAELCGKYLSEPFEERTPVERPSLVLSPETFRLELGSDTYQAHTLLGGRAFGLKDARHIETGILLNILAGQSTNSRLNLLLREKHGWVYGVESSSVAISDVGWWQIYFGSDPANARRALEATRSEIARFCANPLPENILRAWKKQIKGQFAMSSENPESLFLAFGRQLLHYGDYEGVSGAVARIDAVTSESLYETARVLFAPEGISRLVLTGKKA